MTSLGESGFFSKLLRVGETVNARGIRRALGARGGGFTYVEALMTALVIVVMAGVSLPVVVPRYRTYQIRAAAWQIAGDLRLSRQRAVTTRNPYRFVFADAVAAADPNTYAIQSGAQQGGVRVWVQERPPAPGVRTALAGPIHIHTSSTPRTRAITFNPNGSVVPTGTIRLAGSDGIALSVTVDQAGRVQVRSP